MGPPISRVARSTSTWIHWWSAGGFGELVHPLLRHLQPIGYSDFLTHQGMNLIECDGVGHGRLLF